MSEVPSDLKYAKSHEWARVSGAVATVGISDHAQHELTDVVFVELPEPGRKVRAGDACAVVESVKTASDIYSPVSGEIAEVNPAVVADPALVNREPVRRRLVLQNQAGESRRFVRFADAGTVSVTNWRGIGQFSASL